MGSLFRLIFCSSLLFAFTFAWDSDDLEVFDAVEEVGQNFYDLLEIKQEASSSEIKKAFRKLSLVLHPDKNPAPDAEVKFRQLVSVYDVLRDANKRRIYHDVLENGLPDWKHAVYYYRRVRKMGLVEMSVILFVIITVGQYLVAWAAYFEKRYAIQEFINAKKKSLERKQKRGKIEQGTVEMLPDMLVSSITKPTMACTLPVQICKLIWFLFIEFPPLMYHFIRNYIKNRNNKPKEEEESSSEEEVVVVRERGPRRRKGGFKAPELSSGNNESSNQVPESQISNSSPTVQPTIKGGLWTDEDFDYLIKLMKKFPPGSVDRWDKIGEAMMRSATEVAHMAHKIKDQGFNPFKQTEEPDTVVPLVPKKVKTRGAKSEDSEWSQVQQKALEAALAKYPKGAATSTDRWEKIAALVPGKNKDECMLRFKHLADLVKKKKDNVPSEEIEETCEKLTDS